MEHATIRAYQERMEAYLAAHHEPTAEVLAWQARFVELLAPGATVLELGSGPGADADRLEAAGLRVLRSDATPAFAERLRSLGHDVLDLDVRHDPIPAADAVFANAVLLHLEREELVPVLLRIHDALPAGGILACSLKEGDGDEWHDRKLGLPRHFVYWREAPLREALEAAGLTVLSIDHVQAAEAWLQVVARA